MKLLFMGPPGAGKGTQAQIVAREFQIPQISTGEILRGAIAARTELGIKAREFMDRGDLVPDEVVIGIVKERILEPDASAGFILDGFPRTVAQADALKRMLAGMDQKLDWSVNLVVPDEELVRRLLERARIENRPDDTEEVIENRLKTYYEKTLPLIDYYRGEGMLVEVDGVGELAQITERVLGVLKNR